MTGVGGTGVVTIGALLGMAAFIEGKGTLNLDMAGMAQKGGAVWSHIRVASHQDQLHAPRIAEGEADLLLGCDLVVSANTETLLKMRQGVSRAVINSEENITSAFVRTFARQAESGDLLAHPDPVFRSADMAGQISDAVGEGRAHYLNASRIATALMGDSIATNTFMLGFACQKGWLPVAEASLIQAIELNGTAVAFNKAAFIWGRRAAVDLSRVEAKLAGAQVKRADRVLSETLEDQIARRVEFLTHYQNAAFAARYHSRVKAFVDAETALTGKAGALSEAVARYYFKVLAIKDEYEVARLYTRSGFLKQVESTFEGDYRLRFHLAPPILNRTAKTGKPEKSSFGPWMLKGLRVLAGLKDLRNTWADPFARTHERKAELAWREAYVAILDEVQSGLSAKNLSLAVSLLSLPDAVRGYGHVKDRYLANAYLSRDELLKQWREPALFHEVAPATRIAAAQL